MAFIKDKVVNVQSIRGFRINRNKRFDSWWHHLVEMLIADNDAVSIFALSRLLEIDTTLILHKIKALLSDPGNKALFVIDKPHEP